MEENPPRYFKLIDSINYGMIIKTVGRKQYSYVFGEAVWQRTWLFTLYHWDKTGFADKYEEITEEQAYEAIKKRNVLYHKLEAVSEDMLKKVNGLIPETQTKDLEIRIIYLLYCVSKIVKIDTEKLQRKGFLNRIIRALNIPIKNGSMKNDQQIQNILDTSELKNKGFPNRIIRALNILIENGAMENDQQMQNIIDSTFVLFVKSEDIYQNGQKTERDKAILEKKMRIDKLISENA